MQSLPSLYRWPCCAALLMHRTVQFAIRRRDSSADITVYGLPAELTPMWASQPTLHHFSLINVPCCLLLPYLRKQTMNPKIAGCEERTLALYSVTQDPSKCSGSFSSWILGGRWILTVCGTYFMPHTMEPWPTSQGFVTTTSSSSNRWSNNN